MSNALNEVAQCFVAQWDDKPVAFHAVLPLPNGKLNNAMRASRTVVLPDYQGLGIGSTLSDTVAGIYKNNGLTVYTKTVNPALGLHRDKSPLWEPTTHNHKTRNLDGFQDNNGRHYLGRPSYCHKYVGPPVQGFDNLVLPIDKIRRIRGLEGQLSLF